MARVNTYRCDGCGALKGAANEWWMVGTGTAGIEIWRWSDDRAQGAGERWLHMCGRECVQKLIERWMGEQGERNDSGNHCDDRPAA